MAEKVKLTREQEEALVLYKSDWREEGEAMGSFVKYRKQWTNDFAPLKEFTYDQFARLLYEPESYEVEEEYKVGEWVKHFGTEEVGRVYKVDGNVLLVDFVRYRKFREGSVSTGDVERPTPEEIKVAIERFAWAKIGREPEEFKVGDAYRNTSGITHEIDFPERIHAVKKMYEQGRLSGFYPAESFIEFGGGEE